jgi:hypothetical protein
MNIRSKYTHRVMPNKTIYVKDSDLPLLEQAQEQLGDSISSMFADFLRQRVARLTPEENTIIELINRISKTRESVKKEGNLSDFVDGLYAHAEISASKALKSVRAHKIRETKTFYWEANWYYEKAQRDVKEIRETDRKIAELLGGK